MKEMFTAGTPTIYFQGKRMDSPLVHFQHSVDEEDKKHILSFDSICFYPELDIENLLTLKFKVYKKEFVKNVEDAIPVGVLTENYAVEHDGIYTFVKEAGMEKESLIHYDLRVRCLSNTYESIKV